MPTILLRRGTTAEREAYTPLQGEIIFDTTTNHLYAGDGSTQGGLSVITINGKILDGAKNGIDLITLNDFKETSKNLIGANIQEAKRRNYDIVEFRGFDKENRSYMKLYHSSVLLFDWCYVSITFNRQLKSI